LTDGLLPIAVPILFTFFGAILGFVLGRLRDWLDESERKEHSRRWDSSVLDGQLCPIGYEDPQISSGLFCVADALGHESPASRL
jgi:hypothetical protein